MLNFRYICFMKIYVITKGGDINLDCYTSISAVSRVIGVSRQTLVRHLKGVGRYYSGGFGVYVCRVNKVVGRGGYRERVVPPRFS